MPANCGMPAAPPLYLTVTSHGVTAPIETLVTYFEVAAAGTQEPAAATIPLVPFDSKPSDTVVFAAAARLRPSVTFERMPGLRSRREYR